MRSPLTARLWAMTVPLIWILVLLSLLRLGGHVYSGRLPAPLVRAVPALAASPSACERLASDPVTPANGFRRLGYRGSDETHVGLVFVHGYQSAADAWKPMTELIDKQFRAAKISAQVYYACYPSQDTSAFELGADAVAKGDMLNRLPPTVPVIFVGHSFGGIVIKNYLLRHYPELDADRIAVVTVNSPHHGTPGWVLANLTGESLLYDFRPTADFDVFGFGGEGNPTLAALNERDTFSSLNFYSITGTYVSSPVTAFLGGTFIAQSDGIVPARSAHLVVPRDVPAQSDTYLDGIPYTCGVSGGEGAQGIAARNWQFTFSRPLHRGDIFHVAITDNPTVLRILMNIIWDPANPEAFTHCQDRRIEPLDVGAQRPWAYAMALAPMLLLAGAVVVLRRFLPGRGHTRMALVYGLCASLAIYFISYATPLALHMALPVNSMSDGVWMAMLQAFVEEGAFLLWFTYFLRQAVDRQSLGTRHIYVYAILFGYTLAALEQVLFVYTTGGADPSVTWLRLLLAAPLRVGFALAGAWAVLQRERLAAVMRSPQPATRRLARAARSLVWLVPGTIHATYSALFFHVIDMTNAVALYLLILSAGVTWLLAQHLKSTIGGGPEHA